MDRSIGKDVFLVFLTCAVFYIFTAAPSVLWGDDAYFQRTALTGTAALRPDGSGHWVWMQLAHLFTKLPFGTVAYRVNLLSAVAAAVTVGLLYGWLRLLAQPRLAALIGCAALAVAHTFWGHAVRAEVYTLYTAVVMLHFVLWAVWTPNRVWPLYLSALLLLPTLLVHQMGVLLFPAFAVHLWLTRQRLTPHQRLWVSLCVLLGIIPFWLVINSQISQVANTSLASSLRLYFTTAGDDYSGALFDFSSGRLRRDFMLWLGFLGFQFVGLAFVLGLMGLWRLIHMRERPWLPLLIFYVAATLFAFSYHVTDQYVFYLPSYLAFAAFVAYGAADWPQWLSNGRFRPQLSLGIILLLPIGVYGLLATVLDSNNLNPLDVRSLPYRPPNQYFLWPAKNGYWGADTYGRSALTSLPPNSTLVAEHTPYQTLKYLQTIENVRPDVKLVQISPGGSVKNRLGASNSFEQVYLADNNPAYYNTQGLTLQKHDLIYRVEDD